MAKTREYMDYLDNEIGIAPANSQEEFQAAETIVEVMKDHDLQPTIQEFDAHPLGKLVPSILMVVMFAGMVFAGLGSTGMRALGLLLTVVPAVLLLIEHSGNSFLQEVGPASKSQNVIAVHRATGDKVTKGSRPIVIVAHYDTPHESLLFGRLAAYQSSMRMASVPCVVVVLVAAILQVMTFLPAGLRVIIWIVGLVAALLLLLLAVVTFVERFSACTLGANDNKSSVAALLSLVDRVQPMDDRVNSTEGSDEEREPDTLSSAQGGAEGTSGSTGQNVLGVRHGKEVLEQLGILPDTCEIVYEGVDDAPVEEPYDSYEEEYAENLTEAEPLTNGEDYEQVPDATYDNEPTDVWEDEGQDEGSSYEEKADADSEPGQDAPSSDGAVEATQGYEEDSDPSFEQEEWNTDATYDTSYEGGESVYDSSWSDDAGSAAKAGLGERLRGVFRSLKERIASHRSAEDVSIPRGTASDASDFSEFEETDWDEDGWSDDAYQPQEELEPINRDEMIARRSASATANQQEYVDEPTTGNVDQQEDSVDSQESVEWDDEGYPTGKGRTSHDISHDDGPDWSVVEEEQTEEVEAVEADFTADVYDHEDEEQLDELYDLDAESLEDVEDELEDDQLAGATPEARDEVPSGDIVPEEDADIVEDAQEEPSYGGNYDDEEDWGKDDLDWDAVNQGQTEADDDDVLPKDTSGLDNMSDDYEVYGGGEAADEQLDEPEPIDDPTWGHTSYEPPKPKTSVARRATLYDVPNPSDDVVDPLSDTGSDEDEKSEENRSSNWKGGAAIRSDLLDESDEETGAIPDETEIGQDDQENEYRQVDDADGYDYGYDEQGDEGSSVPDDEDVQDAILSMADDLLISHDIWFVAVGCSSVDHAGMKAFLSNFRQDIRGAFLINLDSIGAGTPTILTNEGLHAGRRADRRLVRLLSKVADDLHVDLQKASYRWDDTDATPAMRARVRAVTIMGMDGNGLPAFSHTQNDVPENVNPAQVSSIVRVITETIRRS